MDCRETLTVWVHGLCRLTFDVIAAMVVCSLTAAAEASAAEPALPGTAEALVLEAELCPSLTYPWRPVRVGGASGGLALAVPEGSGSDEAFDPGFAGRAEFVVPAGGARGRRLWLRLYWNGNCSNSLYARCEPGRRWTTVTSHTMRGWHWLPVDGLTVPAGGGMLVLANREDGVWVDQLCVAPEGSPAPAGVLETTPGWPAPGPALPPVSMVPCPGGAAVEALPPTEYLLHHRREARVAMPCEPVLPVFGGRETPLAVWLRWNRDGGLPAELVLEPPQGLAVEPASRRALSAAAGPLECLSFTVRALPELPRGYTRLACRLRTAEGLEQVREARVLRPYRWLVSQAYRLNPEAGLDQSAALDDAVAAAPLATTHGVAWQDVQPDHFTAFGLLNLRQAVSSQPFVQAYAFARVPSAGGQAVLDLTHDDWIRVWVNGTCVYSSQESAPSTLTRVRVEVNLRSGENEVLVRCAQLRNYWEFGLVAEAAPATTPPGVSSAAPVPREAWVPVSLPPWRLESIEEDLGALMGDLPPGEGWRAVAAACREGPLVPVESWQRLVSRLQGYTRSPDELLHCADSLLDLRRRAEAAQDLPWSDLMALVALTFRERAAILSTARRPVEAAEETMGAICWAPVPRGTNPQHSEVVRLFLSAGAIEEALAYLAGPAADLPQAQALRGVVWLYQGDMTAAAPLLEGVRADAAGRYAGWLLRAGRAPEAEWLLRRIEGPTLWNRLSLATAYADQRRFVEAGDLLWECLLHPDAQPYEWANAASQYADFHAARCSIPAAVVRVEGELARLPPQAEDLRLRLLDALVRLHEEAADPVPLILAAADRADEAAQRYRQRSTTLEEGRFNRAMSRLSEEQRYEEMIRLCNRALSVSPGLRRVIDVWRLDALTSLRREEAAAAVLGRLMRVAEGDAGQARRVVGLLGISRHTAPAASRLARALLVRYPDDRTTAADAWLAIAGAGAVLGQYADTVAGLDHALALQDPGTCSPEDLADLARSWVERCLHLSGRDPALGAALLAFSGAVTRQAAAAELGPARSGLPWALDLAHGPSASAVDEEGPTGIAGGRWGDEALVLLREMGNAGAGSHYAVEPGDPARVWVLPANGPPLCASMGKPFRIERFPDAFRAWGSDPPAVRAIAFLEGLVWLGTDQGLYCYRRSWNCWDRLRWPGDNGRSPVTAVTNLEGVLEVNAEAKGGGAVHRQFDLATWTWLGLSE